ncbi:MAG: hypothetical protein NTZ32_19350 [Planctomycetales bacterium]|nr:hypothetical protein [Planctomycetales bacterium]
MRRFASCMSILGPSIALMIFVGGCGGKPEDGFTGERGRVSGKITLGGQPVQPGGAVVFMSSKGSYLASGVIAEGGKYSLRYRVKSGLPAVEYLVQLSPPGGTSTQAADPKMATAVTPSLDQSGPFPVAYLSTATSKLKFTVKAGPNTADFDLIAEKK